MIYNQSILYKYEIFNFTKDTQDDAGNVADLGKDQVFLTL